VGLLLAEALPCAHIRQVSRVQMRTPLYLRPDRRVARAVASAHACGGECVWWRSQALGALLCSSLRSKRAELLSLLPSLCAGRHVRVARRPPRRSQPMRDTRSRCATPAADMPRVGCARAALLLGPLSLALPVARTPRRSDPRRTDPRRSDPWTPIHRRRGYIKYRDVSGRCIDNHLPVRPDTEGNRYIFLIQCISDTVDTAIHGDTSYRMYHPPSGRNPELRMYRTRVHFRVSACSWVF
jgi:hypothetical protein